MEFKYANIIIDISSEKLDRTFQYRIPEGLADRISPGVRVVVPFGRGSTSRSGYVIECTDRAEIAEEKIKEIEGVEEGAVPIESRLIALAAWVRRNYGGTMNQALKTVLPVARIAKQKEKKLLVLTAEKEEAEEYLHTCLQKRHVAKARLLSELIKEARLKQELVTGKLHVSLPAIRALEKDGLLKILSEQEYRNPIGAVQKRQAVTALNPYQRAACDRVIRDFSEGGYAARSQKRRKRAHVPSARRHRQRKDRGIYGDHRGRDRRRETGDHADPGDRPYLSDGDAFLQPLRGQDLHPQFPHVTRRTV